MSFPGLIAHFFVLLGKIPCLGGPEFIHSPTDNGLLPVFGNYE